MAYPLKMNPDLAHLCGICLTDLSGEDSVAALSSSPACSCRYHTTCLIRHSVTTVYWSDIFCPSCNAVLFTRPANLAGDGAEQHGTAELTPSPIETVMATPAAMAEVVTIKKKMREAKKELTGLLRHLRQKNAGFKAAALPYVQAIRQLRAAAKQDLRGSAEKKAARSTQAALTSAYARFKRKYGLSSWNMRELGLSPHAAGGSRRYMYRSLFRLSGFYLRV